MDENKEKMDEEIVNVKLTPLPASAIKPGRGGGKRAFYTEYVEAIENNRVKDWIDQELEDSSVIYIALKELANVCDIPVRDEGQAGGRAPTSIFWGFHYALWKQGIWISQATLKENDEPAIAIRYRTVNDRLSASLRAKLKAEELTDILEEVEEQEKTASEEEQTEEKKEEQVIKSMHLSISEKRKVARGE